MVAPVDAPPRLCPAIGISNRVFEHGRTLGKRGPGPGQRAVSSASTHPHHQSAPAEGVRGVRDGKSSMRIETWRRTANFASRVVLAHAQPLAAVAPAAAVGVGRREAWVAGISICLAVAVGWRIRATRLAGARKWAVATGCWDGRWSGVFGWGVGIGIGVRTRSFTAPRGDFVAPACIVDPGHDGSRGPVAVGGNVIPGRGGHQRTGASCIEAAFAVSSREVELNQRRIGIAQVGPDG